LANLTSPKLDDRSYEELRDELVRRIPVHSREWSDHNASDPGIALLELFSWLSSNLLYRMNRAPEKARREFLRLLNLPLRPAESARTLARFALKPGGPGAEDPLTLEFSPLQPRTRVVAGDVPFQVIDEIVVLPLETRAFIKRPVPDDAEVIGEEGVDQLLRDHFGVAGGTELPFTSSRYEAVPLPPVEGGMYPPPTSLDAASTVDRTLWIAVLAPEKTAKKLKDDELSAKLAELRLAISGALLSLGVLVDDELCGASDHARCPEPGSSGSRYPLVWQVATGTFGTAEPRVDNAVYRNLRVHRDDTGGLLRSAVVRLELPAPVSRQQGPDRSVLGTWVAEDDGLEEDMLGVGELPPLLDDDLQRRVLTWIRCFRPLPPDGQEAFPDPELRWVDANVVEVEQQVTAASERLGYGNGAAGQTFDLAHAPVVADTLALQVREAGGWVAWHRVDDLARSRPNDPHYELDAVFGRITFGDGVNGRMPLPGELVRALGYAYGGGARGNVPAASIARIETPRGAERLVADNPFPATGGRDEETEEQAVRRIPEALRHRERAVAGSDFQQLALETPGQQVGRAHVLPRHKPHERIDGVPGVVTLIVLPAHDPLHPNEPRPDRRMLRAVCEHLEHRRLVTTELYVTPPEYVPVWISVAIEVEETYGFATVNGWVDLAVRQYLAPLPPYGPDGSGWPFGRNLRAADVEAAVLRVEGVRLVHDVQVEGVAIDAAGATTGHTGNVPLGSWQLPVIRKVQVAAAEAAEPIDRTAVGDPGPGGRASGELPPLPDPAAPAPLALPIPVKREEC
jgi:hypothetical protein